MSALDLARARILNRPLGTSPHTETDDPKIRVNQAAQIARLKDLTVKTGDQLRDTNTRIKSALQEGEDDENLHQLTLQAAAQHQRLIYLANVGKEIAGHGDPHFGDILDKSEAPYKNFPPTTNNVAAATASYSKIEPELRVKRAERDADDARSSAAMQRLTDQVNPPPGSSEY